ncbi:hypothetical protein RFI_11064 [Reticulomyxa filosa]|uniref:YbaK/aminoacyl-tRNA synthetase-associated domain-containing protein n=1 Tax=Reticulomyxa filosa TaxID=46433 RepID=X6NIC0_RETFI|nr:hypothetical protein RFI_11064 [Reticulomyxa filosa]|eukprot:ETO26070.1 hypothetical protein RFI_11064 [Reticulomyxa filosa]
MTEFKIFFWKCTDSLFSAVKISLCENHIFMLSPSNCKKKNFVESFANLVYIDISMSTDESLLKKIDNVLQLLDSLLIPGSINSISAASVKKNKNKTTTVGKCHEKKCLNNNNLHHRKDEVIDLKAERPIGHSTHNLLVKEKGKNACYLITHSQKVKCNLNVLRTKIKAKELRLANSDVVQQILGFNKGCITALSLLNVSNNTDNNKLQWVLDRSLLDQKQLSICAGCLDPLDHSQHHVVDIAPNKLLELTNQCGFQPIFVDF